MLLMFFGMYGKSVCAAILNKVLSTIDVFCSAQVASSKVPPPPDRQQYNGAPNVLIAYAGSWT